MPDVDEVRLTRDAIRYGFAVGKRPRARDAPARSRRPSSACSTRPPSPSRSACSPRPLRPLPRGRADRRATSSAALDDVARRPLRRVPRARRPARARSSRFFRLPLRLRATSRRRSRRALLGVEPTGCSSRSARVAAEAFAGDLGELPEPLRRRASRASDERRGAAAARRTVDDARRPGDVRRAAATAARVAQSRSSSS